VKDWKWKLALVAITVVYVAFALAIVGSRNAASIEPERQQSDKDRQILHCREVLKGEAVLGFGYTVVCVKPLGASR
jgi:hypothetical protein